MAEAETAVQQAHRIRMDVSLLKAAISGNIGNLHELLRPAVVSNSEGSVQIPITAPEDAAAQKDTSCLLFGVTPEGNTALHIAASLGHLELAEEICQREISLLAARNRKLDTPLHCAARAGHYKVVSRLIECARKGGMEATTVLKVTNWEQNNALHEAAKFGHVSAAKFGLVSAAKFGHVRVAEALIHEKAGLSSMLNDAGMSPLYLAIVSGSVDVAKALLQPSPNGTDYPNFYAGPNERTALHEAALLSPEIVKDILKREPRLIRCVDSEKKNPLHVVAACDHSDVVEPLLKCDPSIAYQPDAKGLFPIHIAASMGHTDTVWQILQQCPEADELLDKEGRNFLHVAFQRKKLCLVKRIISKKPDLKELLNDQDNEGNTPLHTAVENGHEWSVYFLLQDKSVCLNVRRLNGSTPLDLAYEKMDKDMHFRMNANDRIAGCLALAKASFGREALYDQETLESSSPAVKKESSGDDNGEVKSSGDDKGGEKSLNNEDEEVKNYIGIIAVLVVTVTFAAGFTLPGGYVSKDDDRSPAPAPAPGPGHSNLAGTAVLGTAFLFKVFLISDAIALVFSILATWWLLFTRTTAADRSTRRRLHLLALGCLHLSLCSVCTAFGMGVYLVLPPDYKGVGIFVCAICLAAPAIIFMAAFFNISILSGTIIKREGFGQCIRPNVDKFVYQRLGWQLRCFLGVNGALLALGINAFIFLLAVLYKLQPH